MKHLLFVVFLSAISFVSFAQENAVYEYLSIFQERNFLYISDFGNDFEKIKIEVEKEGSDIRPIYGKVEELENDGWEFVSNSFTGKPKTGEYLRYHVLMRKRKK